MHYLKSIVGKIWFPLMARIRSVIPPLTTKNLWLFLCVAIVTQSVAVFHTSQPPTTTILAVLIWGGALICIEDQLDTIRPTSRVFSLLIGTVILLWVMVRSSIILHWDGILFFIAPISGVALALLCKPMKELYRFKESLLCLLLLPSYPLLIRTLPEKPISLITARISGLWLQGLGFNTLVDGRDIFLRSGGVRVMGPCNGLDVMSQLFCIAVIFLLAFPIRSRLSKFQILLAAPVIGALINTIRIALLALIANSGGGKGYGLFEFFHKDGGSLVFSGVGVVLFGMLYMHLLEKELPPLPLNESPQ